MRGDPWVRRRGWNRSRDPSPGRVDSVDDRLGLQDERLERLPGTGKSG